MFTELYDVLVTQLQKNLDRQDFYRNILTEIYINGYIIQFIHPWYIKDVLTKNDVFPEKAQTDIDKEFEPSIALYLTFSMKGNRQELACFKELETFAEFKEIKDFGTRIYAMDFDTNVDSAASVCISIAKNIFNAEQAEYVTVITIDTERDEQICDKKVRIPKKDSISIKTDGVATRVVEETNTKDTNITTDNDNTSPSTIEEKNTETITEQQTSKDPVVMVGFIAIIMLLFLCLIIFISMRMKNDRDNIKRIASTEIVDTINTSDAVTVNVFEEQNEKDVEEVDKQPVQEESKTEIIGKWRETSSGNYDYIWLLEKDKSNGKYQLTVNYPGGVSTVYNCIRKKIKKSNSYLFHDPELNLGSNGAFTLKVGEIIYFIPGFDGEANAILIQMPGNINRVYTNDIDNRYYELFANLKSIN